MDHYIEVYGFSQSNYYPVQQEQNSFVLVGLTARPSALSPNLLPDLIASLLQQGISHYKVQAYSR